MHISHTLMVEHGTGEIAGARMVEVGDDEIEDPDSMSHVQNPDDNQYNDAGHDNADNLEGVEDNNQPRVVDGVEHVDHV